MPTNPTIYDVAKKAGVSSATVSRVIHTPERVSETVRNRVYVAFEELKYSYNTAAANMSKGTTSSIGVLAPSIRDSIFTQTLIAIQKQAFLNNHYVIVADTNFNPKTEKLLLEKFVEQRLAGILLIGYCPENEEYILRLNRSGVRIIVLWEIINNSLDFIGFDNYNATKQMMEHLISLNHKKFGFIFGRYSNTMRTKSRFNACIDTLTKYSIPYDKEMLVEGYPVLLHGYNTMKHFLEQDKKLTAIVCNNDLQAIGAIKCLKEYKLRVPEDVSVCGFDDIDVADYFDPALTTIKVPAYEIGELAINTLLDNILKNKPIVSKMLDTKLIIRDSCTLANECKKDIRLNME